MGQISWDDAFGKNTVWDPIKQENVWAIRTETGVLIPKNGVDIDAIREDHQKLAGQFRQLYEIACRLVDAIHPAMRDICEMRTVTAVEYRLPDPPHVLETFVHERTAHVVAMSEPAALKRHPLVDHVFPSHAFNALSREQRLSLFEIVDMKKVKLSAPDAPPERVRYVSPEVLEQILHWLTKSDGTIHDYRYHSRSPEGPSLRNVVMESNLN